MGTSQNCASAAPKPNCGQAAAGSIVIQAGASDVIVTTSKVTDASQILVTADASLSYRLKMQCNQDPATAFVAYGITARRPGQGFTLSLAHPAVAANCYSFTIIN